MISLKRSLEFSLITALLLFFTGFQLWAQSDFGSEKELKNKSERFFKEEDYGTALPLFSQLLSLYPSEANYNYKYGVCLLYATDDKEKPISYLQFALGKDGVETEVYYHLGKAFHLNYRFDEAINQYEKYRSVAGNKAVTRYNVVREIEMCRNGKQLLRSITDLIVVERRNFPESEYFRAYDLSSMQSKLVVKPEELLTAFDKKNKERSNIVVNPNNNMVYFSSYGEDGKTGKDIYRCQRLSNFSFSKPERLSNTINTSFDEDFPFITPDGKTLYFSSKGHNSMGGYDIYRSDYDEASNSWSAPVNMDFAINTPDDDIQYISDPQSDEAFFSSKRSVPVGQITVYRIKTTRIPPSIALVRGVVKHDLASSNQLARISIKNVNTGKSLGSLASNEKTGVYRVNLSNGGLYEYVVECPGYAPLKQQVKVPEMTEARSLSQQILLKKKSGEDKMEIFTFFADTANDEQSAMARAEWLKDKAGLEVNTGMLDESVIASAGKNQAPNRNAYKGDNFDGVGYFPDNMNPQQALSKSKDLAAESKSLAQKYEENSQKALILANQRNNEAGELYKESDKLKTQAEKSNDEEKLQQSSALQQKGNEKAASAKLAYTAYEEFKTKAEEQKQQYQELEDYNKRLDAAVKSNDPEELFALGKQQKEREAKLAANKTTSTNREAENKETLIASLNKSNATLAQELSELKQEESKLDEQLSQAKSDKQRDQIRDQQKDLQADKRRLEQEMNRNNQRIGQYNQELAIANKGQSIERQILKEIENNNDLLAKNISKEEKQKLEQSLSGMNVESLLKGSDPAEPEVIATRSPEQSNRNELKDAPAFEPKEDKKESAVTTTEIAKQSADSPAGQQQNATASKEESARQTDASAGNQQNKQAEELAGNQQSKEAIESANVKQASSGQPVNNPYNKTNNQESSETSVAVNNSNKKADDNVLGDNESINAQSVEVKEPAQQEQKKDIRDETDEAVIAAKFEESKRKREEENVKLLEERQTYYNRERLDVQNMNAALRKKAAEISEQDEEESKRILSKINEIDQLLTTASGYQNKADESTNTQEKISFTEQSIRIQAIAKKQQNELAESNPGTRQVAAAIKTSKQADGGLNAASSMNEIKAAIPAERILESDVVLSEKELETIRSSNNFKQLEKLLNNQDENRIKAEALTRNIESERSEGQMKLLESQQYLEMASNERNKKKQKELSAKAVELDTEGKSKLDESEIQKQQLIDIISQMKNDDKQIESLLSVGTPAYTKKLIAALSQEPGSAESDLAIESTDETSEDESAKESTVDEVAMNNNVQEEPTEPVSNNRESQQPQNEIAQRENSANNAQSAVNQPSRNNESVNVQPVGQELAVNPAVSQQTENSSNRQANEAVLTQQQSNRNNQSANNSTAPKSAPAKSVNEQVKESPEYKEYASIKEETEELLQLAKTQRANADSVTQLAERKKSNAADLMEFASAQKDKQKRNDAVARSIAMENEGKDLENEAQELIAKAINIEQNAQQKQREADDYLKNLDEEKGRRLMMAYNNVEIKEATPTVVVAQSRTTGNQGAQPSVQTRQQEPVAPKVTPDEIKQSSAYQQYESMMKESEVLMAEYRQVKMSADNSKGEAEDLKVMVDEKLELATTLKRRKRKKIVREAEAVNVRYIAKNEEADSLSNVASRIKSDAEAKEAEAEQSLSEVESILAQNIRKVYRGAEAEELIAMTDVNRREPIAPSKVVSVSEGMNVLNTNQRVYNTVNPIPINPALPGGVIYKIQIGAFNRPVRDDAFGNVSPVSGEDAGRGLIRYTAGLFNRFDEANNSRRTLNGLGFNDAFIVAYCNGARITIAQARDYERRGISCDGTTLPSATLASTSPSPRQGAVAANTNQTATSPASPVTNVTAVESPTAPSRTAAVRNDEVAPVSIAAGSTLPQVDLSQVTGLIYTVQVGVYSRPVATGQLFNLNPLYFERTENAKYRYTSGAFDNINDATRAKNIIVNIGITDAFVSAYLNGKRIPMNEANSLVSSQGQAVFAKRPDMNRMPTQLNVTSSSPVERSSAEPTARPAANRTPEPVTRNEAVENRRSPAGVFFKVQLGAFRSEVPVEVMTRLLAISDQKISSFKTSDNLTIFVAGQFKDMNSAQQLKDDLANKGFPDAFVIAVDNNEKISIEEAKQVLNKP
jgi:hypothetical protein